MKSQIWQIMGWFEIQKLEYLENGTKLFYKIKKIPYPVPYMAHF